jgi:hypothetical protein
MEFIQQAQKIVTENALQIGVGLLIAVLIAGGIWYWMARSGKENKVLENAARMDSASMDTMIPPSAGGPPPQAPTNLTPEEMEQMRLIMESQKQKLEQPPE